MGKNEKITMDFIMDLAEVLPVLGEVSVSMEDCSLGRCFMMVALGQKTQSTVPSSPKKTRAGGDN